ncbi:MAG: aromatic amino acid transaminase [Rhizobiaceae bacterium]
MFELLPATKGDPILALMAEFRTDDRPDKIDLGVGVYKDADGHTPVVRAVKAAEKQLLEQQQTKSYVGLAGDVGFNNAMCRLILGDTLDEARTSSVQAPGGGGALRELFELVHWSRPESTIWLSDPTWANHRAIIDKVGLNRDVYAYFDRETLAVNFDAMLESLQAAKPGDCVLLHGCCHNPTGANLNIDQWTTLAGFLSERNLIPFIDIAYQGFGDGLDEDAAGVRLLAQSVPEMMIAASCSKNFGLYRDRVGAAIALSETGPKTKVQAALGTLARANYSMPPDHGAAVVRMILENDDLNADWQAELDEMRNRMLSLRDQFSGKLREVAGSDRFSFIAAHRGMFSLSGATPEQVAALKDDHAIYVIGDGRINIAGLPEDRLEHVARAFVEVGM